MPTAAAAKLNMEKPSHEQQQQQQQEALRCPRCDSSNTKFCYYNNYSLSQPRHFCKACKRYWTRGGTLRNVPVGGGCRKNKRIKRHPALDPSSAPPCTDITTSATTSTTPTTASTGTTSVSISKTSIFNHLAGVSGFGAVPPMGLEGLHSTSNGLDLPPMLSSLWLNFPANATTTTDHHQHHLDYSNQNPSHIGQEHVNSTSLPHDYSLLGSSTTSLLTTTLQQQKWMMGMRENRAFNDFQALFPTADLHQSTAINNGSSSFFKGVKMELQEGHPLSNIPCNTSINDLPLVGSDHVNTYWNTGGVGANYWPEATNFGSSVTPLI